VDCISDIIPDISAITFSANCNFEVDVVVTASDIIPTEGNSSCGVSSGDQYTIAYTVADGCGRSASCVQTFTMNGGTPILTCPADQTVSCPGDIQVDELGYMLTTYCGVSADSVLVSGPVINGIPSCAGTTYTYTLFQTH